MPESIEYDVALSFAGENRDVAEKLAASLMHHGVRVFYDASETSTLWGQDLYQYLQRIYRDKATYCVVLISRDYVRKRWTNHELKQAQARAFEESKEYILPIRLDDTEVPGINDTTGYVDLRITSIAEVTRLLLAKLQSVPAARFTHVEMLTRVDGETMRDQSNPVRNWDSVVNPTAFLCPLFAIPLASYLTFSSQGKWAPADPVFILLCLAGFGVVGVLLALIGILRASKWPIFAYLAIAFNLGALVLLVRIPLAIFNL